MLKVAFILVTGLMSPYGYHEFPPYKPFSTMAECKAAGNAFVEPWGGVKTPAGWLPNAGYRCVAPWPDWQSGRDAPLQ